MNIQQAWLWSGGSRDGTAGHDGIDYIKARVDSAPVTWKSFRVVAAAPGQACASRNGRSACGFASRWELGGHASPRRWPHLVHVLRSPAHHRPGDPDSVGGRMLAWRAVSRWACPATAATPAASRTSTSSCSRGLVTGSIPTACTRDASAIPILRGRTDGGRRPRTPGRRTRRPVLPGTRPRPAARVPPRHRRLPARQRRRHPRRRCRCPHPRWCRSPRSRRTRSSMRSPCPKVRSRIDAHADSAASDANCPAAWHSPLDVTGTVAFFTGLTVGRWLPSCSPSSTPLGVDLALGDSDRTYDHAAVTITVEGSGARISVQLVPPGELACLVAGRRSERRHLRLHPARCDPRPGACPPGRIPDGPRKAANDSTATIPSSRRSHQTLGVVLSC